MKVETNLERIADALEALAEMIEQMMKPQLVTEEPHPCRFGHEWRTSHTIGVRSGHVAKPFCARCGLETHA